MSSRYGRANISQMVLTSVDIEVDVVDEPTLTPDTAAAVAETTPGSVDTTSSSNFFLFIALWLRL